MSSQLNSMQKLLESKRLSAILSGDLIQIESKCFRHSSQANALGYQVRFAQSLAKKQQQASSPSPQSDTSIAKYSNSNDEVAKSPFIQASPQLVIDNDFTQSHRVLFNKFAIVPHHVLIVTKEFRNQHSGMDRDDFDAVIRWYQSAPNSLTVDGEQYDNIRWLCFYNCGVQSGASQAHRHVQFLPFCCDDRNNMKMFSRVPLDDYLSRVDSSNGHQIPIFTVLGIRHYFIANYSINNLFDEYQRALAQCGLNEAGSSFNLLMTDRWLLIVARQAESAEIKGFEESISINALGYAGLLLTKNERVFQLISDKNKGMDRCNDILRQLSTL
ncbi:hypothetical protein MIR68_004771 [Amoeboaphelidium protococcarum]|nr:hypothetical protein MIR68_004771 [Amoeboaphelidium protococcarum]